MKRIVLMVATLLVIAFSLVACSSQEPQKVISNELGIDVSDGNEISSSDTHGGFNRDGTTYIALEFTDNKVLEQIRKDTRWKSFPLDSTVRTLIYGTADETSSIGPYVSDSEGKALIPDIQNGYYLLIDRHAEADKNEDILLRGSFNFTLGIYDSNTNTLYFCKLDT